MGISALERIVILGLLALVLVLGNLASADPPADLETIDRDSLTELVVQLNDDQGNPVAGAAVMVYAMRMREEGGHGYWNEEKLGPPRPVYSSENGKAVVKYPANVYQAPKTLTTSLVTFSVKHASFVSEVVHFDLGPQVAEVTLKKGCEIQLSAVDENGERMSDFGVMIAGPLAPGIWADDNNGGRHTGSASDGTWQTMLVKPQDNGITLFSTVLPLRVRPSQAVKIRNIPLKPGTQVNGKLSDNVPRPVNHGYVVTTTAPKPANNSWDKENPSLTWVQWEPIADDGTFELKSIPSSGELQIIALCDGWLSKTTIPGQLFFVMGQLFPIESDKMEVTVEMERTGTIDLTISDPDGQPLNGGTVSSWPNQKYYKGGSTLLGMRYNSIDLIENQLLPRDKQKQAFSREYSRLPFVAQPIENGTATLSGLPLGKANSLVLQHPDLKFDSPNQPLGPGEVSVTIDSHQPKQLALKTEPVNDATAAQPSR